MLLAGDKSKGKNGKAKWSEWYKEATPKAEELYREHISVDDRVNLPRGKND